MADNPFEKVLDRLREKGWVKYSMGSSDGPNCIRGAINNVEGLNSSLYDFLVLILREQYTDRLSLFPGKHTDLAVEDFNDDSDTTFADVERVLEKAAVKWEEEAVTR